MKKLLAVFLAFALFFSPVGHIIFDDEPVAEAKRYKSGKKSFNVDKQKTPTQSNIKKEKDKQNDTNSPAAKKNNNSGGLMKGLLFGGLAGLLFGGLLANMGALGSIVGLLVNILAILALVLLIKKVVTMIFSKKKEDDDKKWQH